MDLSIKEAGYHSFNHLVHNRLQKPLNNEKHFFCYKNNPFSINIESAPNDFMVKPSFCNSKSCFKETWILHPYTTVLDHQTAFVIESETLNTIDDLIGVLNNYGFTHSGKLSFPYTEEILRYTFTDYLRTQIFSLTNYKVNVFYDKECRSLIVQDYFQTASSLRIVFLEEQYWFIPVVAADSTYAQTMSDTIKHLLNHYELLTIFAQKK